MKEYEEETNLSPHFADVHTEHWGTESAEVLAREV
jgi:hypothetical protein